MGQDDEIKTMNEEAAINAAFQDILDIYLASQHRKKVELITKAFNFARQAHKGVRRHSGEPYIMHPLAVARIVCAEIGLGSTSICAALLHDVVEDTDYTIEDIERIFGHKIASMVDGLTKMSGVINADTSAQAEYFRNGHFLVVMKVGSEFLFLGKGFSGNIYQGVYFHLAIPVVGGFHGRFEFQGTHTSFPEET